MYASRSHRAAKTAYWAKVEPTKTSPFDWQDLHRSRSSGSNRDVNPCLCLWRPNRRSKQQSIWAEEVAIWPRNIELFEYDFRYLHALRSQKGDEKATWAALKIVLGYLNTGGSVLSSSRNEKEPEVGEPRPPPPNVHARRPVMPRVVALRRCATLSAGKTPEKPSQVAP